MRSPCSLLAPPAPPPPRPPSEPPRRPNPPRSPRPALPRRVWCIRHRENGTYFGLHAPQRDDPERPEATQTLLFAFRGKHDANLTANSLSNYREMNGRWPERVHDSKDFTMKLYAGPPIALSRDLLYIQEHDPEALLRDASRCGMFLTIVGANHDPHKATYEISTSTLMMSVTLDEHREVLEDALRLKLGS